MHLLVIIAEYNPFHQGHRYHLKKAMEETGATHSLVLMGGNFLQRGDVAIFDKFIRAKKALEEGADLVAELPFIYASSWAREFAEGGVNIFSSLPIEATLSFGSETGDLKTLLSILESIPEKNRSSKESYGGFLQKQMKEHGPQGANDVLGLEYLRAWNKDITKHVHTLKRIGQHYHEEKVHPYPSATSLRRRIKERKEQYPTTLFLEDFQDMIYGAMLTRDMEKTYGAVEGLQHRLLSKLSPHLPLEEFVEQCSTRRYRPAAIRRLLIHHLLNYTKEDHAYLKGTVYLRPLAYTLKGAEILKELKDKEYPLITSLHATPANEKIKYSLDFDLRASKLYHFKSGGEWKEYKRNLLYTSKQGR